MAFAPYLVRGSALYSQAGHCTLDAAMPKSVSSYYSYTPSREGDDEDDDSNATRGRSFSHSPKTARRPLTGDSELDLRSRLPSRLLVDDHTSLLDNTDGRPSYRSVPASPRMRFKRQKSHGASSLRRNHSRHGSFGYRVSKALGTEANDTQGRHMAFLQHVLYHGS